ncbi:MAG TPA: radical SAM protein, partial [Blastocatellia bacterium]
KKILSHITDLRSGKLNDPQFNSRMKGQGVYAEQIRSMFMLARRRAGIESNTVELSTSSFRVPDADQPSLFDNY